MMKNSYFSLGLQTLGGAIIMYLVMFVMIDRLDGFNNNLNMLYLTLMMVAPMGVMFLAMAYMFKSKAANMALIALSWWPFAHYRGRTMALSSVKISATPSVCGR